MSVVMNPIERKKPEKEIKKCQRGDTTKKRQRPRRLSAERVI